MKQTVTELIYEHIAKFVTNMSVHSSAFITCSSMSFTSFSPHGMVFSTPIPGVLQTLSCKLYDVRRHISTGGKSVRDGHMQEIL